jgi:nucleoside-diphosphate-sugar epimerase
MRILMTGHLGYIGAVAVPMFLERGHEVVGLDSDLYGRCTFGDAAAMAAAAGIPQHALDIRDVPAELLAGFDAVVHFAGLSNDPLGDLDPALTDAINHRATLDLAAAAKAVGVERFVFASSCSNYGAAGDHILDEGAAFNPVTPYGQSKVAAERGLLALADDAFSPVLMRSATAYGASPRLRFDLVVNNLAAWAHTTGDVFLKSDGTPWRPIVHIRDIARAFLAAVEAPRERIHAEAFNVGRDDENFQIAEIAEIVREAFPGTRVRMSEQAGPDRRSYRVDCGKLARVLPAARPEWTARRGIEELRGHFRRSQLTLEEFEGPRYQRVAHLKGRLADRTLASDLRPVNTPHAA